MTFSARTMPGRIRCSPTRSLGIPRRPRVSARPIPLGHVRLIQTELALLHSDRAPLSLHVSPPMCSPYSNDLVLGPSVQRLKFPRWRIHRRKSVDDGRPWPASLADAARSGAIANCRVKTASAPERLLLVLMSRMSALSRGKAQKGLQMASTAGIPSATLCRAYHSSSLRRPIPPPLPSSSLTGSDSLSNSSANSLVPRSMMRLSSARCARHTLTTRTSTPPPPPDTWGPSTGKFKARAWQVLERRHSPMEKERTIPPAAMSMPSWPSLDTWATPTGYTE